MIFGKNVKACGYEVVREGGEDVMYINCNPCNHFPSLEDDPLCMLRTIDKLASEQKVSRLVFNQRKNYIYDYNQTQILLEIANLYSHLTKQKNILGIEFVGSGAGLRRSNIHYLIFNLLRSDPIGSYVGAIRFLREGKIVYKRIVDKVEKEDQSRYLSTLNEIIDLLGKTKLINQVKNEIAGYEIGDRTLYKSVFRALITPDFMFTRLMARIPLNGEELDAYQVGESEVKIFRLPGKIKNYYHITPPEFKISEDKQELLNLARNVLAEHKPREEEFLDPERMRTTFFNIGRDLLIELAEAKGYTIPYNEIEELAKILVRHTVGFGIMEVLLQDEKVQDVTINGPIGQTSIFITHQDYEDCVTNVIPSQDDADGWATKFRLLSGRPLDEANPVLDTELILPGSRNRVAIVQAPLNPWGIAYAFRRHRDKPWTLPLFIKNRMINSLAAGLISFLIDGARTMIIAGTRSSGKTSFLGSCMVDIMRRYRIITIEDTLELPTEALRGFGYNIQPMKVRSALATGGTEIAADEGIRTSLRLGDSSLIVGEVRSTEARALYEAMRIGALANVVAGTIHGDSPYGVFDRVVNDLEVPKTSFKATDIIIICNPIKSPDGMHKWRRVMQITEVRKHWQNDPLHEKGFVDLMKYNPETDELEPTDDLINGESEILKNIAGNVKEWAGNWDAIWDNIMLRASIRKKLVEYAENNKMFDLLEAEFVISGNDQFHRISETVREDAGEMDSKKILFEWEEWLKREISKKRMKT